MKKLLLLFVALLVSFTLAGCEKEEEVVALPDTIDMSNVDQYLDREDVQYVDVRDFDEKMYTGYIAGFENIPYFDYLKYQGILVDLDGDWVLDAGELQNQAALENLFDKTKTIFIMCGSGTRAQYIVDALESIGYEDLYNVGGFTSYAGENKVLGDSTYVNVPLVKGDFTPGTYIGVDPVGKYVAYVVINAQGGIQSVFFDAIYGDSTKQDLGMDYGMNLGGTQMEWFEHADLLAAYVVANQGWGSIALAETAFDSAWDSTTVPSHVIEFDTANMPEAVAGVTVGAEGFVFAWNLAIAQASDSDLGVVATTITLDQWIAAHADPVVE